MEQISNNISADVAALLATSNLKQSRGEIAQRAGGRIHSPKLRKSIEQSEDFTGLEEGIRHYDLLNLVKRAGKSAGFTSKMIELLDHYMAYTKDVDWEEGSWPIVYKSLESTAMDLDVTERQIQILEKKLFEAGALTWHDSANRRRTGQRDPDTGRILWAFGVDLTPLAYLKPKLEDILAAKKRYQAEWKELKRQISWHRSQIRASIAELALLVEEGRGGVDALDIEMYQSAYDDIAGQIRSSLDLSSLNVLLAKHKTTHVTLLNVLGQITTSQEIIEPVNNTKETKKDSGKSESMFTHYKGTSEPQFDKSNTNSRPASNCFQKSSSRSPDDDNDQSQSFDKSQEPKGLSGLKTEQGRGEESLIEKTGLAHITWKQVLNAASPRFMDYVPRHKRQMEWSDLVEGAYGLKAELGIPQKSWVRACEMLGKAGATICILLTDQAVHREEDPVRKPAAYFHGMLKKAEKGKLHLHKSIFGILKSNDLTA